MGVDECKFDGYFYFCSEEETEDSSAFPIAIIAGAAGALLLILAIIVIILIRKKMAKKKAEEERDLDQHYQMLHNANTNTRFNKSRLGMFEQKETSFSRRSSKVSDERRSSSAWSNDGRASVSSETTIGSRFFESPIMFMGDSPSDANNGMMSPTGSRSFSPLGFFNKKSVTPQSITVSPPARDVPEKFKSKQDFTNVKTEGKSTFSAVSKLIDKARKDNGTMSPHPAPAVDGPGARRVSSPTSPGSSGFFSYQSPRQSTSTPTSPTSPTGGFFGRSTNQTTPLPNVEPNAPSSIFGGNSRGTPKPSFGVDAPTSLLGNRGTPKPTFGSDPLSSPSPVAGETPTPWKKAASIPRIPGPLNFGNGRKNSSSKNEEKQHIIEDIDMM